MQGQLKEHIAPWIYPNDGHRVTCTSVNIYLASKVITTQLVEENMSDSQKLTKKQKKALKFKGKLDQDDKEGGEINKKLTSDKEKGVEEFNNDIENSERMEDEKEDKEITVKHESPSVKKKNRRSKKNKEKSSKTRFILFVGNLPYGITEDELAVHFQGAHPDTIRTRKDKGIAFLEFDISSRNIQHRMEVALRLHHSTLKNRKVNVELTAGGGGNSRSRIEKLKEKNKHLKDQRKSRRTAQENTSSSNGKMKTSDNEGASSSQEIHPSRLGLVN